MTGLATIYPHFSDYASALIALTLLCFIVCIQSVIAGAIGLGKSNEEPGLPLKGTHNDFSFRSLRTYANSVENLPMFGLIVLLAVFIGAEPKWVNWLAVTHVVFRVLYWAVYYSGIGKVEGGPRTIIYVIGLFANLILAGLTLFTII